MADAWEQLVANSTIQSGDAWEHLLAQGGGSGPGGSLVLFDGLEVQMDDSQVDVEIDLASIDVKIENQEFDVEINTLEFDVEVG